MRAVMWLRIVWTVVVTVAQVVWIYIQWRAM